jgi:hypothetical protein
VLVVRYGGGSTTYAFPAESEQVVGARIQLVDIEQALARFLCLGMLSKARTQRCAQQKNIRVALGFWRKTLHHLERFR